MNCFAVTPLTRWSVHQFDRKMGDDSEASEDKNNMHVEEKQRLRGVFDEIAEEFSESRDEPWREVLEWVEGLDGGGLALDLGCGNGRHLPALQERFDRVVGLDFSQALLEYARGKGWVVEGELTRLPFQSGCADAVLYVAGLHHLPSRRERLASLDETARVLRGGGRALVSVWAIEHPCFDGVRSEIREAGGDYYVSWGDRDRYYYVYDLEGFRGLLEECGLAVEELRSVEGNYYAWLYSGEN